MNSSEAMTTQREHTRLIPPVVAVSGGGDPRRPARISPGPGRPDRPALHAGPRRGLRNGRSTPPAERSGGWHERLSGRSGCISPPGRSRIQSNSCLVSCMPSPDPHWLRAFRNGSRASHTRLHIRHFDCPRRDIRASVTAASRLRSARLGNRPCSRSRRSCRLVHGCTPPTSSP
jgi:hypothetical protein